MRHSKRSFILALGLVSTKIFAQAVVPKQISCEPGVKPSEQPLNISLDAGAVNAALTREWLSSSMNDSGLREHIMKKLAAGGMSREQIAQFMNVVDQNVKKLEPHWAMMGGGSGVLIRATGMALGDMAYSGGKADALTALQANAALLGQTQKAQALGQEYRKLVGCTSANQKK